jgi:hypothetical protein
MRKPDKKKRPADPNMRMHSILQDVLDISSKPIHAPKKPVKRKK